MQARIRELIPAYGSAANPVDVTPAWSLFATVYPALVDLLALSGEVDAVVPVLLQRSATDRACVEGVRDAVARLRADDVPVPVYVCWVAPRSAREHAELLQASGVPVLDWPARTARALGLARRAARRPSSGVLLSLEHANGDNNPPKDDPVAVAGWLRAGGVAVVEAVVCVAAEDAVVAADGWEGPVVVKVARSAHRSDSGGVRLGLTTPDDVRAAAAELLARGGEVLVSPQLAGVEVAVGALRDPSFGPVVMVGLGGIWVEVLADVAFAVAPLSRDEARELLLSLRGAALLTGGRGTQPVDVDALADVVVAVGDLLAGSPGVQSIDLNPVLATPGGATAVDWKLS